MPLAVDSEGCNYNSFNSNAGQIAVYKLNIQGNLLNRFGKLEYDPELIIERSFFEPRAIAVSPDGRFIFIVDGYDQNTFLTAFLMEPEE